MNSKDKQDELPISIVSKTGNSERGGQRHDDASHNVPAVQDHTLHTYTHRTHTHCREPHPASGKIRRDETSLSQRSEKVRGESQSVPF